MRKHILFLSMLGMTCWAGNTLSAQQLRQEAPLPCRAHEANRQYFESNYEAQCEHEHYRAPRKSRQNRPDAYTIPIVIHVFGTDFLGQKVDDALIQDAIRRTNEDFQGLTSNWGDDNPLFDGIKRPLSITFKIAEKDPAGNATTGILYHPEEKGFGNYWHDKLPTYAWDNYSYMNIYLMVDLYGDGVTNNSGVSWYPDKNMSDQNLARVTYNPRYIGKNTTENFRRVLTHEFGHFLNLAHTFDNAGGKFADGCACGANGEINPGDYVDDTPAADKMLMGANDLNCHGELTNWTNFMNYTDRYSMFTAGQVDRMLDALDHSARITLWSEDNLKKVFFDAEGARLLPVTLNVSEATANDGSVLAHYAFKLQNAQLHTVKTFKEGTDYSVSNLPSGLTPRLVATNETELRLFLDGAAVSHTSKDNTDNIIFTLNNSVLNAGELYRNDVILTLNFLDPYNIVHQTAGNIEISQAFTWKYLKLDKRYENSEFGIMYDAPSGKLFIESYQKPMTGTGNNLDLSIIGFAETINSKSKWVTSKGYPNLHTLVTSSYKDWYGKTGFVGFQFRSNDKKGIHYGWMRITVAEDGKSFILKDYAFNEAPGQAIAAGQTDHNPPAALLVLSTNELKEDPANNGSISSVIKITIMGDNRFVKQGILVSGTDFSTNRIPKGMTPCIEITSPTEAIFSLEGKAASHESRTDYAYLSLKEHLFASPGLQQTKQDIDILFIDPYRIVTEEVSYQVGPGNTWKYFALSGIDAEYGAWVFAAGHLKLQTYSKQGVCYTGTKHLIPLAANVEIGPDATWEKPADQYENVFDIHSAQFGEWKGKTAYAGIKIPHEGNSLYGWLKIAVNPEGTGYHILETAYNEAPNTPIMTGQLENDIKTVSAGGPIEISYDVDTRTIRVEVAKRSRISVFSINGSLILSTTVDNRTDAIAASDISSGIYLIHVENEELSQTEKLIIP